MLFNVSIKKSGSINVRNTEINVNLKTSKNHFLVITETALKLL